MNICEVFDSIQGEGPMIGTLSTFVRVTGCNLCCKECDTKYSWPEGREWEEEELRGRIPFNSHLVLTGGEPLLQPDVLVVLMDMHPASITVETNGTQNIPVEAQREYIHWSVSPKPAWFCEEYEINTTALSNMAGTLGKTWFKIVVRDIHDIREAMSLARFYGAFTDTLVLQPPNMGKYVADGVQQYLGHLALLVEEAQVLEPYSGILRILPQLHTLLWPQEPGK